MNKSPYLILLIGLFVCFGSCNPDCENFARINATITPRFDLQEGGFLLTTSPANYLQDKDVFIKKMDSGNVIQDEYAEILTTAVEEGYLIKKADLNEGSFDFFVRDKDCGGFIRLNTTLNCESLSKVKAEISPRILVPGQEVLVRTTPEDFLVKREIFVRKSVYGVPTIDESTKITSRYSLEARGRIATIPRDIVGDKDLFIKDEQCGGFVPLKSVRVADQSFIENNLSLFASPGAQSIYIPIPPSNVATNIANTWFSPINRDYCIWFVPELDETEEGCFRELPTLRPGNRAIGPSKRESGSWETRPGCAEDPNSFLYDANPLTGGVIDTLTGYVSFVIDRTSKGLGTERYEGSLVDPSTMPEEFLIVGACKPKPEEPRAKTMMVVTSEKTGRQLIMYRYDLFGLEEHHGKPFCKPE